MSPFDISELGIDEIVDSSKTKAMILSYLWRLYYQAVDPCLSEKEKMGKGSGLKYLAYMTAHIAQWLNRLERFDKSITNTEDVESLIGLALQIRDYKPITVNMAWWQEYAILQYIQMITYKVTVHLTEDPYSWRVAFIPLLVNLYDAEYSHEFWLSIMQHASLDWKAKAALVSDKLLDVGDDRGLDLALLLSGQKEPEGLSTLIALVRSHE